MLEGRPSSSLRPHAYLPSTHGARVKLFAETVQGHWGGLSSGPHDADRHFVPRAGPEGLSGGYPHPELGHGDGRSLALSCWSDCRAQSLTPRDTHLRTLARQL